MIWVCGRAAFSARPTDEPMRPVPRIATRLKVTHRHPQKSEEQSRTSGQKDLQNRRKASKQRGQKEQSQEDHWSIALQGQHGNLDRSRRKTENKPEAIQRRQGDEVENGQRDTDADELNQHIVNEAIRRPFSTSSP